MVRTVSLDNGDRASSSQVRTGKRINKTRPGDSRAHPRMTTKDNADDRRVSGAADETPKVAKTSGSARHSFRAPAQLGEGRGLGSGSRVLLALQTFESGERRAGSRRKAEPGRGSGPTDMKGSDSSSPDRSAKVVTYQSNTFECHPTGFRPRPPSTISSAEPFVWASTRSSACRGWPRSALSCDDAMRSAKKRPGSLNNRLTSTGAIVRRVPACGAEFALLCDLVSSEGHRMITLTFVRSDDVETIAPDLFRGHARQMAYCKPALAARK